MIQDSRDENESVSRSDKSALLVKSRRAQLRQVKMFLALIVKKKVTKAIVMINSRRPSRGFDAPNYP